MVQAAAELLGSAIRLWWVSDNEARFAGGIEPQGTVVCVSDDGTVSVASGVIIPVPEVPGYFVESPDKVDLAPVAALMSRVLEVEGDIVGVAEELTARYEEIDLLYTISDVLGRTMELHEAAEIIVREVSSVVGARRASIFVHDPEADVLVPVAGWGLDIGEFGPIPVDNPKSVAARVFRDNEAVTGNAGQLHQGGTLPARQQAYRGNSYLSSPITYPGQDGIVRPVGVMNLTDRLGADAFSTGDRKLIDAIAHQVGAAVENTRLVALDRQRQRVRAELELAADLQLRLLPGIEVLAGRCDVAARCSPGELVGGDFYNFVPLAGSEVGIMLGDVSTHGFPAALIMALCLSASGIHAAAADSPEQALQELLTSVSSELSTTEMYLTLFYGILDRDARRVRYSNAGHPHAFLLPATGDAVRLEANVPPLGLVDGIEITGSEATIENVGDLLVVFSDGMSDASDAKGVAFSEARVLEIVQSLYDQPTEDIVSAVFDAVADFATFAADDQTFLVVRT